MPRWGMEQRLHADPKNRSAIEEIGALILDKLGLCDRNMRIEVYSEIPRAMGLGWIGRRGGRHHPRAGPAL